jgi:ankyrin repeat protein
LDHGANINSYTQEGLTLLHSAALCGYTNTVSWLIEHGANLNLRDSLGENALHKALFHKRPAVAKILIQEGIDISQVTHDGKSILWYLHNHFLYRENRAFEIAELLLQKGANSDVQDVKGDTLLHKAVIHSDYD